MPNIQLVSQTGTAPQPYQSTREATDSGYHLFTDNDGDYVLRLVGGGWALCERGEDMFQTWDAGNLDFPLTPILSQSLVISN